MGEHRYPRRFNHKIGFIDLLRNDLRYVEVKQAGGDYYCVYGNGAEHLKTNCGGETFCQAAVDSGSWIETFDHHASDQLATLRAAVAEAVKELRAIGTVPAHWDQERAVRNDCLSIANELAAKLAAAVEGE